MGRWSPRPAFACCVVMLVPAGCTFVFERHCLDLGLDKFPMLRRGIPCVWFESPIRSRRNVEARPLCVCVCVGVALCCDCSAWCLFGLTSLGKATGSATGQSPEAVPGGAKLESPVMLHSLCQALEADVMPLQATASQPRRNLRCNPFGRVGGDLGTPKSWRCQEHVSAAVRTRAAPNPLLLRHLLGTRCSAWSWICYCCILPWACFGESGFGRCRGR